MITVYFLLTYHSLYKQVMKMSICYLRIESFEIERNTEGMGHEGGANWTVSQASQIVS